MDKKIFILIDGHALIYRAYHAFVTLTTSKGELVNAVYGFTRILLTVMREFKPEYIAVAFDHHQPTFRHAEYIDYKSTRPEMPDDLKPQIDIIKKVVSAFNIPQFILPGYEADDLIGTMARQITEMNVPSLLTMIVTGDRDAFQLIDDDHVHVWMPGRGKASEDREYDPAAVKEKMGVTPEQIVDLKALMGDTSDNIPGITGVGEKTATRLLQEFGTLEKLYAVITAADFESVRAAKYPKLLTAKLVQKLAEGHQDALMSQKLATIDRNSPITVDLESCRLSSYKKDDVIEIFQELEFDSLMRMLPADAFELEVQQALF
jgi:DNA polymerase-1